MSFQSTHPVRGATSAVMSPVSRFSRFQSTHPVRGATDGKNLIYRGPDISIHAPREGCDFTQFFFSPCNPDFNPRTP